MLKRIFAVISVASSYIILTIFIHEAGHAITGKILGLGNPIIYVWPGVELYPNFGLPNPDDTWPENALAYVSFMSETKPLVVEFSENTKSLSLNPTLKFTSTLSNKVGTSNPIVGFMGSGTTYLISLFCTVYLWLFNPKGSFRNCIVLGTFLFYDLLFYTVFPIFFGVSHLVLIGGDKAEPIIHLAKMGVPIWISVTLVIVCCFLQVNALIKIALRDRLFDKFGLGNA